MGGRDRAAAALFAAAVLARADGAAADRSARLSARLHRPVLRRLDQRHVHARADRPSRLAARAAGAQRCRDRRSQAGPRRPDARDLHGAVAGDRARDDHLSRASPAPRWCCSGSTTPKSASGCGAYALSLGGGTALGFLVFASYDNRLAVCDALSPVWLSDALLGGALLYGLRWLSPARLEAAAGAGASPRAWSIAAFHALTWPHCLQRLEGVSPEVERLWLSHVKEARPIYRHGWRIALADRRAADHRRDRLGAARMGAARATAICCAASSAPPRPASPRSLLLLWQTRTGPASQMMATVGARRAVWYPRAAGVEAGSHRASGSCGAARSRDHRRGRRGAVRRSASSRSPSRRRESRRSARPTRCAHRCGACSPSRFSRRAWSSPSWTWGRG